MKRIFFAVLRALGSAGRATIALIGIFVVVHAFATNYTMTQGAGTTFGSIVVSLVNYPQMLVCDLTTPSQCAAVSAAGAVKVDNSAVTQPVSNAGTFATQLTGATNNINNIAGTVSLPTGASTSGNQTSQITQETAVNTVLGTQADAACGTDNGSCSAIALIKRGNQDSTTLNTTATNPPNLRGQTQEQTAVSNGTNVPTAADAVGKLINMPYANKENFVYGTTVLSATTASTQLIAAPGANNFIYLTSIQCINSDSTNDTLITLQNGNGGSTIWQGSAGHNSNGFVIPFPVPIGGTSIISSNTALFVKAGTSVTQVVCNAQGYKGI